MGRLLVFARYVRYLVFFAVLMPALPQSASVGVKLGSPLTAAYSVESVPDGAAFANEERFTVGPTLEVHLPLHLSVEVDALWRRSSFRTVGGHFDFANVASRVNDWQFPLLAKYERPLGPVSPFVDGGVVYRHVSADAANSGLAASPPAHADTTGISVGGGVAAKLLRLRIAPEVRYTRWPTAVFNGFVVSTGNQVDLLVGISF